MIKSLLALMCMGVFGVAFAAPNDERSGVCYLFKGDRLLSKGVCVVSTGGGAGGFYEAFAFKGKKYIAETALCFDKESEADVACGTDLNGLDAEYYHRNLFYIKTDPDEEGELSCYASKKIDICYK